MKTLLHEPAVHAFITLVIVPFIVFLAVKYGYTKGSRSATMKH